MEPFAVRRTGRIEWKEGCFDVAVCGGTLGIFLAASLQRRGIRVVVIERMRVVGRDQEWNISRAELDALVRYGVLEKEQVDASVSIEFNPVKCKFHGSNHETLMQDILNLGVSPKKLVAFARSAFEEGGGVIIEDAALAGVEVFDDCARLNVAPKQTSEGSANAPMKSIHARLVLDCMGNGSPIARQLRKGRKPDGVCLVVGTCAGGFDAGRNKSADFIVTKDDIQCDGIEGVPRVQYFWQAFPAGSGPTDRTTYMFSYIDADESRASIVDMLEDYWRLMPQYQGVDIEALDIKRVLFGCFPTYRDSPLKPGMNRVMEIGDASGIQSPLSFGGFGALTRHLGRLSHAVEEALNADCLEKRDLMLMSPYYPSLSVVWLFQHAMSVRPHGNPPPSDFINKLLATNFKVMEKLGDGVLRPFNQDVVQFVPLTLTLFGMMFAEPLFLPVLLRQMGFKPLGEWFLHYVALGLYTLLYLLFGPSMSYLQQKSGNAKVSYRIGRLREALQFGSGLDYES